MQVLWENTREATARKQERRGHFPYLQELISGIELLKISRLVFRSTTGERKQESMFDIHFHLHNFCILFQNVC